MTEDVRRKFKLRNNNTDKQALKQNLHFRSFLEVSDFFFFFFFLNEIFLEGAKN
jgi:hypothetical protein